MSKKEKIEISYQQCVSKREFLKICGKSFCTLWAAYLFGIPAISSAQKPEKGLVKTKLSPYFTPIDKDKIQCDLCPRFCRIPNGERGFCGVRMNQDGKCYSLVYGNPCVIFLDKIEREAFFHVLPGSSSLTLSTVGCNFHCKFCENWEISQAFPEDVYNQNFAPELVVEKAKLMGARSITYTYAEPTIYYEYMLDIAGHAKKSGLLNIIHSNGFINPSPLKSLCKVIDAAHIDLKGFTEASYQYLSEGNRDPVLQTLKTLKEMGIHLEVSSLIIPTWNNDISVINEMSLWIKKELGTDVPIHLSRFYPLYKLQRLPPTPISILEEARQAILSNGHQYVYLGKVPGHEAWNTYCPNCKKTVIHRMGYMIENVNIKDGRCEFCGNPIPGLWD